MAKHPDLVWRRPLGFWSFMGKRRSKGYNDNEIVGVRLEWVGKTVNVPAHAVQEVEVKRTAGQRRAFTVAWHKLIQEGGLPCTWLWDSMAKIILEQILEGSQFEGQISFEDDVDRLVAADWFEEQGDQEATDLFRWVVEAQMIRDGREPYRESEPPEPKRYWCHLCNKAVENGQTGRGLPMCPNCGSIGLTEEREPDVSQGQVVYDLGGLCDGGDRREVPENAGGNRLGPADVRPAGDG
jgi:DNA-directed RNA polymerase subunit RPC12/RpoP